MNRNERRVMKKEAMKRPAKLTEVPKSQWPHAPDNEDRVKVWVSRDFLVQAFKETAGVRLTVSRTTMNQDGRWEDGITWDELQEVKRQAGFGTYWAQELYPPDRHVVDDANMRHLWIMGDPGFGWKRH